MHAMESCPKRPSLIWFFILGTYFDNGSMRGPSGNHVGALL